MHSNQEKELDEVLAFATDGTICRGSTLLGALGDKAPSLQCGGVDCCDNCRLRLGLEGSPLALKNSSRTVSIGRRSQDKQDMINCNLDITRYVLETLREAKVTGTKTSVSRLTLRTRFVDGWDNGDCPSSSGSISAREWDRISPIRGICMSIFLRRQLLYFLQEQMLFTPPTSANSTLCGINKVRLAKFMADAVDGKTKIMVRNVRLFQSYLDVPSAPANSAESISATVRTSAAPAAKKDAVTDAVAPRDEAVVEETPGVVLPTKPPSVPEEDDELYRELLENEKLFDLYEKQDDSHRPVKLEELRAIDNGATFFPRLSIPYGSLSWITSLPHLIQYEIWRLWNDRPRKLTMDQLAGSIRTYLEQHPTITLHDACVYILSVANDSSAPAFMDALKSNSAKDIESKVSMIFSAVFQSTGDKLSLGRPELATDCRVYRKFDSSRFLRVRIPTEILDAGTQPFHTSPHGFDESGAMLNTPLYVAGRYYRYIFPDIDSDSKSLLYFAERGAGIGKEEEMSIDDVRRWCIPRDLNGHLTVAEEQMSMNLCFAPSTACCLLPSESVSVEEGPSHDSRGVKFNGGCGRISQAALDLVWASIKGNTGSCPWSSFEGSIGCMKGVWVLDRTLGDEIKVICRPSQQIFNLPMGCLTSPPSSSPPSSDDAYDTVELQQWDTCELNSPDACLNVRLIQALEHRKVSAATLRRCAEIACINGSVSSLQDIRARVAYPLEKSRVLRILPDHTGLLKPGEAFLATRQLPLAKDAGQVIVSPENPLHGDDVLKLNLVAEDVLRERDRESSSELSNFFAGLQTGIIIGKGARDPSERSGGEFFGKALVCWLDEVVDKVDGASIPKARILKARQSHRPRIDKLCLQQLGEGEKEEYVNINVPGLELSPLMTGTTAKDCTLGQYLFRKLKQEWFLAQMNNLSTILNDLKGPNSDETIRIAATVDEMVSANIMRS